MHWERESHSCLYAWKDFGIGRTCIRCLGCALGTSLGSWVISCGPDSSAISCSHQLQLTITQLPLFGISHHYPCSVPERHDHLHWRWLTPTQSHQLGGFETEGRPDQHSSQNQAVENLGQPPAMIPSDYVETGSGAPPLGRMGTGGEALSLSLLLCICPL